MHNCLVAALLTARRPTGDPALHWALVAARESPEEDTIVSIFFRQSWCWVQKEGATASRTGLFMT